MNLKLPRKLRGWVIDDNAVGSLDAAARGWVGTTFGGAPVEDNLQCLYQI